MGGGGQGKLNINGDERIGGVINVTDDFLRDDGDIVVYFIGGVGYFPMHLGDVRRDTPVNLFVEVLHNFWPAFLPPDLSARYLLSVLQHQWVGEGRIGRGLRLIEISGMGRFGVAVWTAPQRRDVEQIQSPLMILLGGELHGRGRSRGSGLNCKIRFSSRWT
jgi:hypothetical protein